jgi:hypothetical protein
MSSATSAASQTQDLIDLWLADAKLYGQKDPYLGKRRHPRYQWKMPVDMDVLSIDGSQCRLYAQTRDISEGGIGLECRQQLEPDSRVRIRLEGQLEAIEGYVVHCTQGLGKYLVGVVFAMPLAA